MKYLLVINNKLILETVFVSLIEAKEAKKLLSKSFADEILIVQLVENQ